MPERILIVARPATTSEIGQELMAELDTLLRNGLAQRGVFAETLTLSGLELEDDLVPRSIEEMQPEVVLVLAETGGATLNGNVSGANLEAAMVLPDGGRTVWRGTMTSKKTSEFAIQTAVTQLAEALAVALIRKLEEDGLIRTL